MNERIRELCIQSGAYEHYEVNEGVNGDDLPMQRFAELIIKECGLIADVNLEGSTYPSFLMEQHFGVKE